MSILGILATLFLFFGLVFGLGLPWVATTRFEPAEKLALGAAVGVTLIYLYAGLVYVAGWPLASFAGLLVLTVLGLAARFRALACFAVVPEVQKLVGRLLMFAAWCVGLTALVRSYSGGEWAGDWREHFERAIFFLGRQPLNTLFLGVYSLPARPPLANLVDGAGMALTRPDFAHFQLFNTLCSTLLFLPAVLLARHFARGKGHTDAVLLLVFMLNPLVVQNATFAWTKLLAAFFVLLSVAFYVRGLSDDDATRRVIAAGLLALGMLTHYSAGPYIVGLVAMQLVLVWRGRAHLAAWRELTLQAALAVGVLAPWFGWSIAHYGFHTTFLSNTTAMLDKQLNLIAWSGRVLWNTFVTLVPHPFRSADYHYIAQASHLGFIRDYLFNIYQTTVPGAFGLAGLVLLGGRLRRGRKVAVPVNPDERRFWWLLTVIAFVLGIASISWADRWGVVHICLTPLVLIGLTWLAPCVPGGSAWLRRLWYAALAVDALFGIAMHFCVQAITRVPAAMIPEIVRGGVLPFGEIATRNFLLKLYTQSRFMADGGPPPVLLAMLLALFALLALRQAMSSLPPPPDRQCTPKTTG